MNTQTTQMRYETLLLRKNPQGYGYYAIRDFNDRTFNTKKKRYDGKLLYETRCLNKALYHLVVARKNTGNRRVYCFVENPTITCYCCQKCGWERPETFTGCCCCCGNSCCADSFTVREFYYRKRIKIFIKGCSFTQHLKKSK